MSDATRHFGTAAPATESFGPVARLLHWTMAGGILFTFLLGLTVDAFPRAYENTVVQIHMVVGLALLVLLLLRVIARLVMVAPPPEPGTGPWVERFAAAGHLALYGLMLVVPLAGLVLTFLRGRGIEFGFIDIPSPLAANKALARPAKEIHELLSWGLMALVGLHVAASFWHHVVLRDGTLRRMLPSR